MTRFLWVLLFAIILFIAYAAMHTAPGTYPSSDAYIRMICALVLVALIIAMALYAHVRR